MVGDREGLDAYLFTGTTSCDWKWLDSVIDERNRV
jgi:hypothetical protein